MIAIENVSITNMEAAIRGMRNPMNSWDKSDSFYCSKDNIPVCEKKDCPYFNTNFPCGTDRGSDDYVIGPSDLKLARKLTVAGTDHRKFMRMITVSMDITAPLYWWKEADTYKVGTVRDSCSTMHKIQAKKFTLSDFSCEHLCPSSMKTLKKTINKLNEWRLLYIKGGSFEEENEDGAKETITVEPGDKNVWWQMIQLLPSSYNQRATFMLNYEVLANMYKSRKNHKLDEWRSFCDFIKALPYSELVTGKVKTDG